jgi:Ca2+-binding RTX toxin-like protein
VCALALAPSLAGGAPPRVQADLEAGLSVPQGPIFVGQQITLTATLTNLGPEATVTFVRVNVAAPGVSYVHAPGSPPTCCVFTTGTVAKGASASQSWQVRVKNATPVTLTAAISSAAGRPSDPNPANDTATVTFTPQIGRCTSPLAGTRGDDKLTGTVGGEVINALGGDDFIRAGAGDDCVNGGAGSDTILGGDGADLLKGGPGDDVISGGPGQDRITGGPGKDRINAADGARDVVNCGPGNDSVKADKSDSLRGCERIHIVR